jgi:hypothetical protein
MINLNINTMIYRPVTQVFSFMCTPENDFQWQYGTLEAARLAEGAANIGTLIRSVGHLMGHRILSTFEVTEYETNRKYGFKSLSGPLLSVTNYTFEIVDGSTKVNVSTQANVVDFFRVSEGVLEKKMKKQLKENLVMLKELLEERRLQPTSEAASLITGNIN